MITKAMAVSSRRPVARWRMIRNCRTRRSCSRIGGGAATAVIWRPRSSDGGDHGTGQLGPADQEIGEIRVGLVVDQWRPIEPSGVQTGRQCDGDRRARVPLVLTAGVGVDLGVAQ